VVAIVGRPNVGKSALFNRLIGRRRALVDSTPGVTRDRLYGDVVWRGMTWRLVDTGGLQLASWDRIQKAIESQVARAMEEASLVLWVCDARQGVVPLDKRIAGWLRPWGKPVFLVANKVETERDRQMVYEFYSLGFGKPWAISSLHGLGVGEMLDAIVEQLAGVGKRTAERCPPSALGPHEDGNGPIRVAIIGRPNVGKSSLINRILNEERVLVDEQPGTTRDPVEVHLVYRSRLYCLVDTAGLHSRRSIQRRMEAVAQIKALQTAHRAEVCVGVLEAPMGLVREDLKILGEVVKAARPLCLVLNKWDLLSPEDQRLSKKEVASHLAQRAPFLRFAPVVCTSAKTGFHVLDVLKTVERLVGYAYRRLSRTECRQILKRLSEYRSAPSTIRHARWIRLTQVGQSPPQFHLVVRAAGQFRQEDLQFLETFLRQEGQFDGVPVRLRLLRVGG